MTQRLQGGVVNHATAPTVNAKQTVLDACRARTADVGRKRKVPAPVAPGPAIEATVSAAQANWAPDKTGATTPRSRETSH